MKSVLLTIDALRADHLGQYGYERDTMPALDRLVDVGTRYELGFANGTNTGISLPSLLTSRYFGTESAIEGPNVATAIGGTGAATAGFHSNTLFSNRVPRVAGFDYYEDYGSNEGGGGTSVEASVWERVYQRLVDTLRPIVEQVGVREYAETVQEFVFPTSLVHDPSVYVDAETLTDDVLAWVREHADEEFFLWVHYMDPHRPYGIDVEEPEFGEPTAESEIRNLMSKAGIHPEKVTDSERERMLDLYDSDIRYTSEQISRLFDLFEELNIWEETGFIFTADHGEEFAEHGYYYHRNRPYDELLHVPLVVKEPDNENSDRVVSSQRELLDVAPSLCSWHGAKAPQEFRGVRLTDGERRETVATGSFVEQDHVVAGRWDGWKYIAVGDAEIDLFDLQADPEETYDVSSDHAEVIEEFEAAIPESVFAGEPVAVEADDEGVRRRLEGLGYLE
jgi:arylsulfatase A-like enzyme